MHPSESVNTTDTPPRTPITVRLCGEWKRSLSARARILILAGPVSNADLRDMAHVYAVIDTIERMIRIEYDLPEPGESPQWVADYA